MIDNSKIMIDVFDDNRIGVIDCNHGTDDEILFGWREDVDVELITKSKGNTVYMLLIKDNKPYRLTVADGDEYYIYFFEKDYSVKYIFHHKDVIERFIVLNHDTNDEYMIRYPHLDAYKSAFIHRLERGGFNINDAAVASYTRKWLHESDIAELSHTYHFGRHTSIKTYPNHTYECNEPPYAHIKLDINNTVQYPIYKCGCFAAKMKEIIPYRTKVNEFDDEFDTDLIFVLCGNALDTRTEVLLRTFNRKFSDVETTTTKYADSYGNTIIDINLRISDVIQLITITLDEKLNAFIVYDNIGKRFISISQMIKFGKYIFVYRDYNDYKNMVMADDRIANIDKTMHIEDFFKEI